MGYMTPQSEAGEKTERHFSRETALWQAAVGIKQGHRLGVTDVFTFRSTNQKLFQNGGGQHSDLSNPAGDAMCDMCTLSNSKN